MENQLTVLKNSHVKYVSHHGSDQHIVSCARVSYNAESKGEEKDKKLLKYLFKNKHTSPFEMATITFNIRCPIFVARQFFRHRTFRYNEVSARYTELDLGFYVPEKLRIQDTKNKQGSVDERLIGEEPLIITIDKTYQRCFSTYQYLLKHGVAREMARMVLPVGALTEFVVQCDMNNLIKYFKLRDDNHAQYEHQEIAKAMQKITRNYFPWTMECYDEI